MTDLVLEFIKFFLNKVFDSFTGDGILTYLAARKEDKRYEKGQKAKRSAYLIYIKTRIKHLKTQLEEAIKKSLRGFTNYREVLTELEKNGLPLVLDLHVYKKILAAFPQEKLENYSLLEETLVEKIVILNNKVEEWKYDADNNIVFDGTAISLSFELTKEVMELLEDFNE